MSPVTSSDDSSEYSEEHQSSSFDLSSQTEKSPKAADESRDEIKEIQRMSQKETNIIRTWRLVLMLLLMATAASVTTLTLILLKNEEEEAYKDSFSRTIGNAAITQQRNIRQGFATLADAITAHSQSTDADWPYFSMPLFESHAEHMLEQSGLEIIALANRVDGTIREDYEEWASQNYYNVFAEGNMLHYGNLDRLPDNSTYLPYVSMASSQGFIPDVDREHHYAVRNWSPPPFSYTVMNWNPMGVPDYGAIIEAAENLKNQTLATRVRPYTTAGVSMTAEQHAALHSNREGSQPDQPHSFIWHPVVRELESDNPEIVGVLAGGVSWDVSLRNLLPDQVSGIYATIENNCGQRYSYILNGPDAIFLGEGHVHENEQEMNLHHFDVKFKLWESDHPDFETTEGHCLYTLTVTPSRRFVDSFQKKTPQIFAGLISAAFLLIIVSFLVYDLTVQRRNKKLVANAARSNAIVTSLFPSNVRDRLVGQQDGAKSGPGKKFTAADSDTEGAPIADLFLESTILFADIVGFTAWSSVREPVHVFTLLETLYGAFDEIAERRRVFKVETVGDCYVAATGIPTYRKDHAAAMIRFARDIMDKMNVLTKDLEVSLGPDTGDLNLRIGIHSGPVTAGVLRGQKSRFQLFGDTMNTCSRLESSSQSGKIHISSETAELLIVDGKGHWIERREEFVTAKGKGSLQTYWVKRLKQKDAMSSSNLSGSDDTTSQSNVNEVQSDLPEQNGHEISQKIQRLIDWNTESLLQMLRQVVARRKEIPGNQVDLSLIEHSQGDTPLEEVQEIIRLPEYDPESVKFYKDPDSIVLSADTVEQVRVYVTCIARMYRQNAFHNFEHASHVTMSVNKLLSRIVAPTEVDQDDNDLHDHTYGITSDPLTQFACAFSALIHDVDHTGVPNTQLVKENHAVAAFYKDRSVAEQNSLALSWDLLMDEQFKDFRRALYQTEAELIRFRQLVVNGVMATDIADKDLKLLRNTRWAKAFDGQDGASAFRKPTKDDVDRKATIVIEHLIQASDIAHTMQHWHVYRKWNERLFTEMYQAYLDGRADSDPSTFWYKGEIGFFDFYIIPLAKKLKECGVFGISSDEYLNYALKNRQEWERRGEEVVAEMMSKIPQTLKRKTTRRGSAQG